jgi:hypothetical protein
MAPLMAIPTTAPVEMSLFPSLPGSPGADEVVEGETAPEAPSIADVCAVSGFVAFVGGVLVDMPCVMVVCIVTVTGLSLGIVCVIPESVIVVVVVFDVGVFSGDDCGGREDFGFSGSSCRLLKLVVIELLG